MPTDEFIRKQTGPDPRSFNPKPNSKTTAENKGKEERFTSWNSQKKGDASNAGRVSPSSPISKKSANDFQGQQQKHLELRGACLYVHPQGGDSPIPAGGNSAVNGGTNATDANMFEITLSQDTALEFDWTGFDSMRGSDRGNILVSRCIFMTLVVAHKGFKLTLPAGIKWHDGEAPDLTPDPPVGGIQPDSEHVINLFAIRKGVGDQATMRIFGGLWGSNMK